MLLNILLLYPYSFVSNLFLILILKEVKKSDRNFPECVVLNYFVPEQVCINDERLQGTKQGPK